MIYFDRRKEGSKGLLPAYEDAGLLRPSSRVISLVGAGGKTTTLFMLAEAFAAEGLSVAVTTTTHMGKPGCRLISEKDELERFLAEDPHGRICVCGSPSGAFKMAAPDFIAELPERFDRVLIEADGSKRLPLKVPASHEPVLLPETDTILIAAGLSCLGKPLQEVCHRLELACEILEQKPSSLVNEAMVARLLQEGYVKPFLDGRSGGIILNQADHAELAEAARNISRRLEPVPCLAQCLLKA